MARSPNGQKLGRNQPCWCGSGVKYKNCHLNRDSEKPVSRAEALQGFFSSFSAKECLCPDDWKSQCSGNIVRAHSLSRRNALRAVTEAGHVFSFTPDWGQVFHKSQFVFKEKSAREASTFTGFCGYHDNTIFASLDRQDFDGSAELTVLSAYRTLCREIFVKTAHLRTTELAKTMDRGSLPVEQLLLQEAVSGVASGVESALFELKDIRAQFETALKTYDYSSFGYCNFYFRRAPDLVSAGGFNPSHTVSGAFLQDLGNLATYSQNVFLSVLPSADGFWASFLWPRGYELIDEFVKDVEQSYATVGGIYAVALAHIENTFLRPTFWKGLSTAHKNRFKFLAMLDVMHRDYESAKKDELTASYSTQVSVMLKSR